MAIVSSCTSTVPARTSLVSLRPANSSYRVRAPSCREGYGALLWRSPRASARCRHFLVVRAAVITAQACPPSIAGAALSFTTPRSGARHAPLPLYDDGAEREKLMSVARVSEVTASSRSSFQDAVEQGVSRKPPEHRRGARAGAEGASRRWENRLLPRVTLKVTLIVTD